MSTKHESILRHIRSLDIGSKISVRKMAKELEVSEGTAYRAIKDAENQGFLSTIGRVGTIRIEKKEKENIERLTYAEVINIVEGTVIGGRKGLYKTLNKFVIGAMRLEGMMRYVEAGSLLIVGDRVQAQKHALEHNAAVLITGGFDTTDEIKELADRVGLPIISCSYDTFTVASMINRAIYDRLIKKEIMLVEDILIPLEKTHYLKDKDTVESWYVLSDRTKHSRFPVIDKEGKVQGMVTSKDMMGQSRTVCLNKIMTKKPLNVTLKTSVASAAHTMVWEGIELLPVVDEALQLQGIISRQDVLKAMQLIQKQPQIGETFEDLITASFIEVHDEHGFHLRSDITPQMTNHLGTISHGVLITLMTNAADRALRLQKKGDLVAENLTVYFLNPVQIEQQITIYPKMLELRRRFGKVEIEVYHQNQLVAKAMMAAQLLDRS